MRQVQRETRAMPSLSQPTVSSSESHKQQATDWEQRLAVGDFAAVIREFVAAYEPVTFPEIVRLLQQHLPTTGECGLQVGDDENCVLYGDLSPELADVLHGMLGDARLVARPCASWYYDAAEGLRRLPMIADVPSLPLEQPHWLPCTLHVALPATVKPVQRPAEIN